MKTVDQSTVNHIEGKLMVNDERHMNNGVYINMEGGGDAIAKMYDNNATVSSSEQAFANAQRIVKCVNMHNELVTALKECHKFNGAVVKVDGTIPGGEDEFYEHYKKIKSLFDSISNHH